MSSRYRVDLRRFSRREFVNAAGLVASATMAPDPTRWLRWAERVAPPVVLESNLVGALMSTSGRALAKVPIRLIGNRLEETASVWIDETGFYERFVLADAFGHIYEPQLELSSRAFTVNDMLSIVDLEVPEGTFG